MLEQLFGSRTRWKLLKTFLSHQDSHFYIRELTRITGEKLNSVRRELANLSNWGIIAEEINPAAVEASRGSGKSKTKVRKSKTQEKKYYRAQVDFVLFKEIKDLIMKSWLLVEKNLVEKIVKMGQVKLLILSGKFVNNPEVETDVLVVGTINRDKLKKLIAQLARSFGEDINYTVMTAKEYNFRKDVTDRFLYKILQTGHIKVLDRV